MFQLSTRAHVLARQYAQTARRGVGRYGFHPLGMIAPGNRRFVFVVGCPRSGTTFTAGAIGRVAGFADLGELPRLKAEIPRLYERRAVDCLEVVARLRSIVMRSQRISMLTRVRGVEQTPESTFLVPQLAAAFPGSQFVHVVRDGRDVAASLLDRGWLKGDTSATTIVRGQSVDDGGQPFGSYARFWVEPDRRGEFERACEAERCGWAWRRYVSTAFRNLSALDSDRVVTVRYESMASDPEATAQQLAAQLDAADRIDQFAESLSHVHAHSVGRWETTLAGDQLKRVLSQEAGLLSRLGYST